MDNNSNNYSVTCQIRGNGTSAQFGYNGTGNTFAAAYAAGLAGRSQLRTHILSNGYIVWDLSGNVNEWTSAAPTYGSTFDLGGRYTLDSINSSYGGLSFFSEAFLPFPWVQPSRELSQASGAGWYTGYTTPTHEGGFLRGGTWDGDGFFGAGLFSADSYLDRAGFPPYIGFRCAVTP
jgi:formylglycine-generating enzyme required for sulfatase activity